MQLNHYCKEVLKIRQHFAFKLFLVMKLTILILILACVQVFAKVVSAQKINLSVKNASLTKVLDNIHRQSGYSIFYDKELVRKVTDVDAELKNATVETALNEVLKDQPLTWSIVDQTIVIKEKALSPLEKVSTILPPPPITITGRVTNAKGEPLPGVSIFILSTNKGVITDAEGYFKLQVTVNDKMLVFSSVGMKKQEVLIANRTSINVVMEEETSRLDEVQIIGYGTTTKRLNTGSVSTVKGKQIETRPVSNVLQALQGEVAGVSITNFSPGIGSPVQILIRGVNSLTSGTIPLIIIDGVVINQTPGGLITSDYNGGANTYQQGNSVLNMINPNDIESIDVLKDADATGIYGSRGTNGVILITTKKATLGKTKTSINVSSGWKSPIGLTPRMNTQQYLQMRKDAFATGNMTATSVINPITPTNLNAPDLTLWSQTAYTDYTKFELGNPAPNYNVDATVNGGTKSLNFLSSLGYYKMYDTYMFKPYQERLTGRMQINHTSENNKLNLQLGAIFGRENQTFTQTNFSNVQGRANANPPNFEMTNTDGSLNFGVGKGYTSGLYYNPLPNAYMTNISHTNNLNLTGELSYEFIKNLVAKVQASYGSQANDYHQIYPTAAINVQNSSKQVAFGTHTLNKYTSINIEPQLTYNKTISKAFFSVLAGATFLDRVTQASSITVNNPGSDALLWSYSSGNPTSVYSNNTTERFESVFGRLNVDWNKKYVANFSFRRDGSSRFGTNNRFANFASGGVAWIFSDETFVKNTLPFLSFGKLRGSYGTTGNYNIGNYLYVSLLTAPTSSTDGNYLGNPGLDPANYGNVDIKWETTTKSDIGLELGVLKNRINLVATWYRSLSTNLLLKLPLGGQSGFTSYTGNFPGIVQNTGLEFELTTKNLDPQSKVQWTTKFNITHNANILKSFPNLATSTYATTLQIGRALPNSNSLLALAEMPYHCTGIDPTTGLPQFKDFNGDNSPDFQVNAAWIGTSQPTTWGGMTNSVSYKGFSLDVFVQFSNGIFTKWNFYNTNPIGSMFNPDPDVIGNYWMKPGDVTKYPRLYTNVAGTSKYINPITQQYPYCDRLIYKGYYIRLKNVQLTYSLPAALLSKVNVANASVYISGENLAVYTPVYLGKDPEVYWGSSEGLLRTFTVGIRVNF